MGPQEVLVLSTFLIVLARCAVVQDGKQCRDAAIPTSEPRGVNQVSSNSTKPLFELKLIPRDEAGGYAVRILAGIQAYAFRDVTVAMTTDGTCGKGTLQYDSDDFTKISQDESCPRVLVTKPSTSMTSLPPLLWTPPSCGCVQFRVALALAAENFYYTEAYGASTGALAKHICVQDELKELTKEQRLDALCHVSEKHTSRSIISSLTFRKRHQLDSQYTDRLELEMALELRRSDARMCCSKVNQEEKLKCFERARYRRADRFCQDGFPDIPFVSFRSIFMRSKERRCCSILGFYRYLCFAKDSQLEVGSDVTPMDYSLDATDPANDLADFATLEDYEEVLDQMFNTSTRRHDVLHGKSNTLDANLKDESEKDKERQSQLGGKDGVKIADSSNLAKSDNINPKVTDKKSFMKNSESSYESKTSIETSKPQKPTLSASSVQSMPAKRPGGLSRSEMTVQNSEIYRRLPTYSIPRQKTQTSAERRKHRRRLAGGRSGTRQSLRRSSERQARERKLQNGRWTYPKSPEWKTGSSKNTGRGSRRLTSSERRYRGIKSSGKSKEVLGGNMSVMEDKDNVGGGSTVEDTLNYLDRKMKRLELRRLCCKSGALSGSGVYGSLSVVTSECKHSSHKYLQREEMAFGLKTCRKQFIRCCMDEAIMGVTMSSSEFHNKALDEFLDNDGMIESVDKDDIFLRHGLFRKKEKAAPGWFGRDASVQEILDAESDRRFESMRAEVGDPRFVGKEWVEEGEEEEEKTGPRLFDEEDNRSNEAETIFDDVTNKQTLADKKMSAVSQIKDPAAKSSPTDGIDTEAGEEREEEKDEGGDDRHEERDQFLMGEDFDDDKENKEEGKRSKVALKRDDEMIQIKKNSSQEGHFPKSDKKSQINVTDEQMVPQSRAKAVSQPGSQFQNKYMESYHSINTAPNVLDDTQNRGESNESFEPITSEIIHQNNQTNNKFVEASRLRTDERYLNNTDKDNSSDKKDEADTNDRLSTDNRLLKNTDKHNSSDKKDESDTNNRLSTDDRYLNNADKHNSSDKKDEPDTNNRLSTDDRYLNGHGKRNSAEKEDETDVSEMMHRTTQLQNRSRAGSRLSSVLDKLPNTDIRSRLDLNEEQTYLLRRQQKITAPRRQYYSRSRERSIFSSGAADNFLDTTAKRGRSRSSRPWRKEGGSSRRRFRYHGRRRHRGPLPEKRDKRVKSHKNKEAAMDSQEMADAHNKQVRLTALDSKEMAARYNQGSGARTTFRHKDTRSRRTGGLSKRRRRHRKRTDE